LILKSIGAVFCYVFKVLLKQICLRLICSATVKNPFENPYKNLLYFVCAFTSIILTGIVQWVSLFL